MIKVSKNIFELKNKEICYIIAVNEYGYLENLYFGKRIDYMPFVKNRRILRGHGVSIAGEKDRAADAGNVNFEYSTSNRGDFRTPAFEAELEMDGSSCFDLTYLSHRIVEKDFDSVYDSVLQKLKDMCLQLEQTAVKENLSSFLCPKCRKPFHSLNWGYVCEDCGIKIPFQLGGQKLDDRIIQTILSGEKTKSMSFKKKDGSSFFASLYLDPQEGLKFDFSSGVKCPYCKNDMRHNKAGYFCDCGCKVFSTICGKTLTDGQLKKLITKHSLPEMDGFVSKAGKPFSAALVLEDKSVKLKFN